MAACTSATSKLAASAEYWRMGETRTRRSGEFSHIPRQFAPAASRFRPGSVGFAAQRVRAGSNRLPTTPVAARAYRAAMTGTTGRPNAEITTRSRTGDQILARGN